MSTEIRDANNAPVGVTTTAGTTVHDRATVSGTGPTPTGTVNFTFYTSLDCGSGGVTQSNVALAAGIADSSAHGPLATGSYSFKVHYNGDTFYGQTDSLCEPLEVTALTADLELTKDDGVTSVSAGSATTYTITLKNNGPSTVGMGVVVSDPIPAQTTGSTSDTRCTIAAGTMTCTTTAALAPLATTTFNLTLTLAPNYSLPTLTNTATITLSPVTDIVPTNNTASDTDTVTLVTTCDGKVTGGGEIAVGLSTASFGFNAKCKPDRAPQGQLEYIRHDNKRNLHSTAITSVSITDPTTAVIRGNCMINRTTTCTFTLTVRDNGKSGKNDNFQIEVTPAGGAPFIEGSLVTPILRGNITIHKE